jgi:hypothetical protein
MEAEAEMNAVLAARMTRMALTVKCPLCGEVLSGDDEHGLVASADKHGDERHNGMKASRAMVLGAARKSE